MEEVKRILKSFKEQVDHLAEEISQETCSFEKGNHFKAQCWVAGGLSKKEFQRFSLPKRVSDCYDQPAKPLYDKWECLERDIQYRGVNIPDPKEMTLDSYLEFLFYEVLQKMEYRAVWIKSLRSFINFLRNALPCNAKYRLELLFPEKMEIRKITGSVPNSYGNREINRNILIKKLPPTAYPIDYIAQSEIMENLAHLVTHGRPNIQNSAAEALSLSWCCTICAMCRVKTQEKSIYNLSLDSLLRFNDAGENEQFSLKINSLHGFLDIPISSGHYALLNALPRPQNTQDPPLFTKPLSSLLRTLYKAVNMSDNAKNLMK